VTRRPLPLERIRGLDLTPEGGLTSDEAAERRRRYGPNDISDRPPRAVLDLLRDTGRDPMIWFLLATGALYAGLGQVAEALTLLLAILPLAGMDAFLHRRTSASMEGLRRGLAATARVLRDGAVLDLPSRDIVPGDLVVVPAGRSVPADGLLIAGRGVQVDESALTGESFPAPKRPLSRLPEESAEPLVDGDHWLLAGTRLLTGEATLRVVYTAAETLHGEVVRSASPGARARTPLQRAIARLVRRLVMAAAAVCAAIAAARLLQGHGWLDATVSAVTLATAAPAGGLVVTLTSSDAAVVELVTPTVTVPAGSFGANGSVRGRAIGSATVTASRTDYSSASSLVTATALLNILETSLTVRPSFPQPITVRLDSGGSAIAAPAPGVIVSLVPGNTGCVTTNAPVTIATGLISVQATVSYGGTATLPCTTTLRAESPGVTPETINITVQPDPGITLFSLPSSVGAGLQYGTFSGSLGEANHGGVTVRVTSSNPSVLLLSRTATAAGAPFVDIPVADNQTSFSYVLHGVENVVADATVTASSASFQSATGTVHVVQPAIEIGGLTTSTTSLSPVAPFVARIGVPAGSPTNSFVSPVQVVRVGGQAVTVSVNNSNGNVAQLTNSAGAAQSQTVMIAAGQSQSPSSVATGGVAFDPISPGSTSVSVTATGVIPMTSATVGVTVTAPGIQLFSLPTVVGSGLQYGTFSGQLGGADHQGVDVRIASSNPNILKVSPNATTGGTDSISIHLNPGSISFSYYIHGMEGATGEATLTVSASGFTTATGTAQVATPGIEIGGLPATTTSLAASDAFVARVGILAGSVNNTFVSPAQAVRVGGTPLTVTFTNSNSDVAQLVTATTTGQTATVTIAVGQTQSPGTAATGGVEFDPRGGGSTTVAGSAPGTVPTTAATRSVSVTAPAIQLFSLPASVGSGLQYGSFSGQLGGSQHGGVSVHIASSNPNVLRIAKDSSTAGTDALDIRLENGDISFSYWIQGVEGATGPATITATAPGFTSAQGTANVLQPALHLVGLATSLTSLAANDVFAAQIGVLNGTTITAQSLRPGAASVTATITSSNAAVGQLTTSTGTAQTRTVSIVAGQSQSPGTVATGGIEFDPTGGGTTTVSASIPGFLAAPDASVNVTVTAPGIQLFSLPATVGSGLQYGSFSGQLGGSQHNGLTVRITSSNPSVLKVSATAAQEGRDFVDLPVAAGGISFSYWIHGMERVTGGVTLTVSAPGFTDATGTAFVVQPGIELAGLLTSTTTLSVNDPFTVRTGVPAGSAPNTFISPAQEVRIGGENVVVTITNGTAAAGQLVTAAGADQSRTVTITPGNSLSPGTVAAGGIEFDPLNAGQTTVVASAPGFTQTGAASSQVTVSAPGITLFSLPVSVGSGLMYGSMSGQLGAGGHSGVTVRLTSSNPDVMRLSTTASQVGAASVDITLNPGNVSFSYWIHGMEGAVGDTTITATAPGFVTEIGTVHIVQPGLDILSLASSISATAASDPFVVRVGVPQADGRSVSLAQSVRAGSALTVTVTTSTVGVGQLVTLAGGAASRTITIAAGASQSAGTVAAGGIEFDPLTAGTTTINATIPGVITTDDGTVVVVVGGAP